MRQMCFLEYQVFRHRLYIRLRPVNFVFGWSPKRHRPNNRVLKDSGMRQRTRRILGAINQTDRADSPGNEARNNNKITLVMNEVKYASCKVDRIQKSATTAIGFDG